VSSRRLTTVGNSDTGLDSPGGLGGMNASVILETVRKTGGGNPRIGRVASTTGSGSVGAKGCSEGIQKKRGFALRVS